MNRFIAYILVSFDKIVPCKQIQNKSRLANKALHGSMEAKKGDSRGLACWKQNQTRPMQNNANPNT